MRNIFLIILFSRLDISAQDTLSLPLEKAIEISKMQSAEQRSADYRFKLAYWEFEVNKRSNLPKFSLTGTLPNYYRAINPITLPNGTSEFVAQNVASSSLILTGTQNLILTGGVLSLGSSLYRLDNFGNYKNTAYTSVPVTISYYQRNLFYNPFKGQRKVDELKFAEATAKSAESYEETAMRTIELYYDLLYAENRLRLDLQNEKNINDLVKAFESRLEIGTAHLNDVLQSKVSLVNAKKSVLDSRLSLMIARHDFLEYLNLPAETKLKLALPDTVRHYSVDLTMAVSESRLNKYYGRNFERRRMEVDRQIKRSKAEMAPQVNLNANLGLTQRGQFIGNAYKNLLDNQSISATFSLPLIDFGESRANRKILQIMLQGENAKISEEELIIEKELFDTISKWQVIGEQIQLAKLANSLAIKTYDIARQRYANGGSTFSDFNFAQLEKDRAALEYVDTMKDYWLTKYRIRYLTLYDFENGEKLL